MKLSPLLNLGVGIPFFLAHVFICSLDLYTQVLPEITIWYIYITRHQNMAICPTVTLIKYYTVVAPGTDIGVLHNTAFILEMTPRYRF